MSEFSTLNGYDVKDAQARSEIENRIKTFENVTSMKNDTTLINGTHVKTKGYYTVNDGGSAYYNIRSITNDDIPDEMFIISLSNVNLVAELIYNTPINVLTLGVKNDGTTDISTIINSATEKANLFFPSGKYLVENEITLKNSIFGENFTRYINDESIGSVFISDITCEYENREQASVFNISTVKKDFNINNISIKLKNYECGIKSNDISSKYIHLDKISVNNIKSTGIYIIGSNSSRLAFMDNITLFGTNESYENSRGMFISLWDSKANNIEVMGCRIGAKFEGFVQGSNYHIWCGSLQGGDGTLNHTDNESWFSGTKALITKDCMLDNVYLDTAYYKVVGEGSPNNSNTKQITNLKTLDDNSMSNFTGTNGYNFYNWGGMVTNHVNHVTSLNKGNNMSSDVKYVNENIVLHITETEYLASNSNGSNRYYPVSYKYIKDITNTPGSIMEIAKIKTGGSGRAGIVKLYILHANARPCVMTLRFRNGNFYNATLDTADLTGDTYYITTNKDANNMYTLYLLPNDKVDEYITVQAEYIGGYNNIQVIDLGYTKSNGTKFDPVVLDSTTGLTEIQSS